VKRCRQQGFSLVEMMVALVIGLFVLAGVGSVYITGKRSYQARDGLSLLQENGRIAIRIIEQTVVRAGYPMFAEVQPVIVAPKSGLSLVSLQTQLEETMEPLKELGAQDSDSLEVIISNGRVKQVAGDILTVQYQAITEGSWRRGDDCLGSSSQLSDRVISKLFLNIDNRTGIARLMCLGSGGGTQPLVDNVVAMQVEYGEDSNSDGFADKYLRVADVSDWNKVVAIRVGLLISSGEDVLDEPVNEPQIFTLAGQQVTLNSENDRKLYRVFQTTIPLRNRMPIF